MATPVLLNERIKKSELLDKLDSIALNRIYKSAFVALMRLQIYFTGRTQELLLEFTGKAQSILLRRGGRDGVLDGSTGLLAQSDLTTAWGNSWSDWTEEFLRVRREAGMIAFGVTAVFHDRLVMETVISEQSAVSEAMLTENVIDGVFTPQLDLLLQVAGEYLYGDNMNLSGRVFRIDREARDGINAVLLNGIQKGDSAFNIAKQLEQFLGANEDCPRWTSTRLYGRTKSQIAGGDTTGLLSGDDCNGQGVSYKALRLARNEIQKIHNLATDRMMAAQPWVKEEQIHLSQAHPETDICDDVVGAGREGQGIYEVGEIELPLHPECLCYKTAVLMPEKEFTSQLNGWLKGKQEWAEMDAYASDLGVDLSTSLRPAVINLAVWLFSDKLEEWLK